MIDKAHDLPVVRQVQLLELTRSSIYYQPQPTSETDLRLMRRIDQLHLEHPFAGARMLRDTSVTLEVMLKLEGHEIGRKHVGTLMKKLDIQAIYRKANTSRRNQAHRIYPYLLRDLPVDRPNQVWAMDTTYIPMRRGFVYLSAVLDWATRRVLAWRLSNRLTADPCVEALEEAILKYGSPEIMNTDQGSQFLYRPLPSTRLNSPNRPSRDVPAFLKATNGTSAALCNLPEGQFRLLGHSRPWVGGRHQTAKRRLAAAQLLIGTNILFGYR